MNRRKFFQNLVASVATLVTAHALPLQKIGRLLKQEDEFLTMLTWKSEEYAGSFVWKESVWTEFMEHSEWPSSLGEIKRTLRYDR